jgi:hypothetical protein
MAGTLTISTLSDGANSTSATNCIQGSAKAWVRYNGTTQAINASYNVSSVTYNSTGVYVVNFTNAFADANWSATGGCSYNGTGAGSWVGVNGATTTSCSIQTASTGASGNSAIVCISVFR